MTVIGKSPSTVSLQATARLLERVEVGGGTVEETEATRFDTFNGEQDSFNFSEQALALSRQDGGETQPGLSSERRQAPDDYQPTDFLV